jgi:hypothetical protein
MNDLVDHLRAAVEAGAIPSPISGEAMDSYKLRAAHAGAVLGAKWYAERAEALQREAEEAARAAAEAPAPPPQVEQLDLEAHA